jgi:cytoskeletal protein RodZ
VSKLLSYFEGRRLRVFEDQMLKRFFKCKRRKLQEDLRKSALVKKYVRFQQIQLFMLQRITPYYIPMLYIGHWWWHKVIDVQVQVLDRGRM